MERQFICTRQRAGRLVTEMRMIVPRRLAADTPETRRQKNEILKSRANFARRTMADRSELYLALLDERGDALVYVLTYDEFDVPKSYREMKLHWVAFMQSMRRRVGGSFPYAYAAEAAHGDGRPHFHLIVRPDVKEEWIRSRWVYGGVRFSPLLTCEKAGYYGKGVYFTKEPTGRFLPVGAHSFQPSRALQRAMPKPEKFFSEYGTIVKPDGALELYRDFKSNPFGAFYYAKFLEQK